jgi:hypothetical protein
MSEQSDNRCTGAIGAFVVLVASIHTNLVSQMSTWASDWQTGWPFRYQTRTQMEMISAEGEFIETSAAAWSGGTVEFRIVALIANVIICLILCIGVYLALTRSSIQLRFGTSAPFAAITTICLWLAWSTSPYEVFDVLLPLRIAALTIQFGATYLTLMLLFNSIGPVARRISRV